MTGSVLHPRLAADCYRVADLGLSILLLHRNAAVPWFILVPQVAVIELDELEPGERAALNDEIDAVSQLIRDQFPQVTKLNVAAIGNLVPQLHVHVIGRHAGDPCWPQPVWGHLHDERQWSDADLAALTEAAAEI